MTVIAFGVSAVIVVAVVSTTTSSSVIYCVFMPMKAIVVIYIIL